MDDFDDYNFSEIVREVMDDLEKHKQSVIEGLRPIVEAAEKGDIQAIAVVCIGHEGSDDYSGYNAFGDTLKLQGLMQELSVRISLSAIGHVDDSLPDDIGNESGGVH